MNTVFFLLPNLTRHFLRGDAPFITFFLSKFILPAKLALLLLLISNTNIILGQAASSNYNAQTGTLGTTYSWIDCSSGSDIVSGDDTQATISWPFDFAFYDNIYTTSNSLSICTNGFIRLDGLATTNYTLANNYDLTATATELGQIIALAVYDGQVGDNGGWVRSSVTGTAPNRVFTIEYNNLEIDYNDGRYADVQVSFYETSYKIVLKLGADNIRRNGVDMGIHSGVDNFFNKWQDVRRGTNDAWIEYTRTAPPNPPTPPLASWNYGFNIGTLGTTYNWIDCSSGSLIVSGDDEQAQTNWPFEFNYYDNTYSTNNSLSVSTNGFIRLDGLATVDYEAAIAYDLTPNATNLGQIIAVAVYDGQVGDNGGWVRSLVTGTAPNRIFTIEYHNYEIDYNDGLYASAQVSFYESINKIVLKLGTDNIDKSGVDMGLHSGVNTYFNKWQEVLSGTNNTWIEYIPPYIEVNATIGLATAFYPTVKNAFNKVNDGTHQGVLTVKINHSTTEPTSAVLNASNTGAANYSSINMYPTKNGLSIKGDLSAPIIDFDGADNVTIDGRVNANGTTKDLSIVNTSISSSSGTSAIRYINGASNNNVKYCTIKSSESNVNSGIVLFSTTSNSSGNTDNVIEQNDITTALNSNRPINAIYSSGTSGKGNDGNTISNNNFFNFLNNSSGSNGIFLSSNTSEWTIDGNSFYETESFTSTGTTTYVPIKIDNVSGNGFIVSNNYIGGNAPLCGGTSWTKTNTSNNVFNGMYIIVGNSSPSSIQNNTIQNFNWSNSGIAEWVGIKVLGGDVNIGTTQGNTIGATTGTNSIIVSGGTNGQSIYGIRITGTDIIDCYNNSIGSITGSANSTLSTHIYGIELTGSSQTRIENNSIGSTTTANSIFASSASTANDQNVYGIYSTNTGTTYIHNNTISNLNNNTSNATADTRGLINGIFAGSGINTITENTVSDISIANDNTNADTPSIVGIYLATTTEAQSINQNLIYNISNTSPSFTGNVVGIFSENGIGASAGVIDANFIHSLSVASTTTGANIFGIYENSDGIVYSNNIINLGVNTSTTIYGIYHTGSSGKSVSFLFNTIYISGTNSGSERSYCISYNTNNNTRDLRNNILFNDRTGGTGNHYAVYYKNTGGTFTADYNDYYVTGINGVIGYYGGNKVTLVDLQAATGQDASSLNVNPDFTSAGGIVYSDYVTSAYLPGIAISGIITDYEGITRSDPPKIGALEASLTFVWQGNISTDFATATNWTDGTVPKSGSDIFFADNPDNSCYLDMDRTIGTIVINQSTDKLVVNGHNLTINGTFEFSNGGQIDATASSSTVILKSNLTQSIPDGAFYDNEVYNLTVDNTNNIQLFGTIRLLNTISAISGRLDVTTNFSTFVYAGTSAQTIESSIFFNEKFYNLTIDNSIGVVLNADVTIDNDLVINSGKLFTLSATKNLSVTGTITNSAGNSGFILNSDATGTAALIHNTDNVPATVERYINGNAEDWHFLSAPVVGQEISPVIPTSPSWVPSGSYGNGTGYDLYLWNEETSCWVYKLNTTSPVNWNTVHPGPDFMVGRGYLYSVEEANPTKLFQGDLNNGDVSYGLTINGTDVLVQGFNFAGNPYPSSIDWSAASGWTRANLVESGGGYNMWIWNPAANNYGVYNSASADDIGTNSVTRYIAPMQGFFVEAATTGNLGMSNSIRVYEGAGNWFKNLQQQTNNINLIVTSEAGLGSDEILLEFGFDARLKGAKKLFSHVTTAPALYMNSAGEDLSVGYFTSPAETVLVPINFTPGKDGNFTINFEFDMASFENIWLEDRKENYYTNMKEVSEYKFSSKVSDAVDRFVLHLGRRSPKENKELPARIYDNGYEIVIDLSLIEQNATVQFVDLSGRIILKKDIQGKMKNKIQIPRNNQIILVYVSTSNAFICRKIPMNRL